MTWNLNDLFNNNNKTCLILLNCPINNWDLFNRLWSTASLKICLDGGANRLLEASRKHSNPSNYFPDYIIGDFDSITEESRSFYNNDVTLIKDEDEYSTDYMKSFKLIPLDHSVVTFGGLSGRIDQTIHTLYYTRKEQVKRDLPICIVSENNVAISLSPGHHTIQLKTDTFGKCCGVLPIGTKSAKITTKGLKWDLGGPGLEETGFDSMISTSNHLDSETIEIETDEYIYFNVEFKNDFLSQCPINNVILYQDRAQIDRNLQVDVTHGQNSVTLKNLTNAIDRDSLKVTTTTSDLLLFDVIFHPSTSKRREPEELVKARNAHRLLVIEKDVLLHEIETLNNFGTTINTSQTADPAKTLENYLNILPGRSLNAHTKLLDVETQMEVVQEQIHDLEQEYYRCQSGADSSVEIIFSVQSTGLVMLNLSYMVNDASWSPLYDVRASTDGTMEIDYRAQVWQSTGEDWDAVSLILSTSTPSVGSEIPTLIPSKVQIKPPPQPRGPQMRMLSKAAMSDASAVPEAALFCANVSVQNHTLSSSFTIDGRTTVASDNKEHKVSIRKLTLDSTMKWICVPTQSERAYLQSVVTNDSDAPLLHGDALVFLDGSFVSRSVVPEAAPGASFDLSLGVDKHIKVSTHHQKDHYNGIVSKGILERFNTDARTQSRTKSATFTIHNTKQNKASNMNVVVRSQIPVSVDERVKVVIKEPSQLADTDSQPDPSTKAEWIDKFDGTFSWSFELGANQSKDLQIDYDLEWPEDAQILL
ncbi:hypothetical protein E3Q11_02216 [Wallemia mellicola]|nr:hypothetical protein E3Q14_00100 [Wallemia mellicola]TIC27551.1 hypothetical protein E3Q11_02216 [Wallemia mellicola]